MNPPTWQPVTHVDCPRCGEGIIFLSAGAVMLLWIHGTWLKLTAHRRALRELRKEADGE